MASLDRTSARTSKTTVKQARRVAEAGARKAIEQLGVGEARSAEAPDDRATRAAQSAARTWPATRRPAR